MIKGPGPTKLIRDQLPLEIPRLPPNVYQDKHHCDVESWEASSAATLDLHFAIIPPPNRFLGVPCSVLGYLVHKKS